MGTLGSLDHLLLRAPDVEALAAAYRDALDAVVVEDTGPERIRLHLANVDVVLERGAPTGEVVASFRIADAEGFRNALARTAFEVEAVEEARGAAILTFRDPAGNRLRAIRWGGSVEDLVR